MIKTVSKNGGHLASNLGVVELTVALHKVFNSPNDQIVFDVGHQAYTHKILTGRKDRFDTLRTAALPAILRASTISFHRDTHLPLFLPLSDLQRLRRLKAIRARL